MTPWQTILAVAAATLIATLAGLAIQHAIRRLTGIVAQERMYLDMVARLRRKVAKYIGKARYWMAQYDESEARHRNTEQVVRMWAICAEGWMAKWTGMRRKVCKYIGKARYYHDDCERLLGLIDVVQRDTAHATARAIRDELLASMDPPLWQQQTDDVVSAIHRVCERHMKEDK